MEVAVADTCFLIDWSRYSRRDLIYRLFKRVFIHEDTLNQLKSERALETIVRWIGGGFAGLYPWTKGDEEEVEELRALVRSNHRIPMLERPDMVALVAAKRGGMVLLSENTGVLRVCQYVPEYMAIKVYTALEVLEGLVLDRVIDVDRVEEYLDLIKEYEEETKHRFSERRILRSLNRVRGGLSLEED